MSAIDQPVIDVHGPEFKPALLRRDDEFVAADLFAGRRYDEQCHQPVVGGVAASAKLRARRTRLRHRFT